MRFLGRKQQKKITPSPIGLRRRRGTEGLEDDLRA
jgi:hypothetical protein